MAYKPMDIGQSWEGCRPRRKPEPPRVFRITVLRDQIMYDIEAQLGLMSRSRRTTNGAQDNTLTDTEAYRPMFDRWIDKYLSLAKGRMEAFVLEGFSKGKTVGIDTGNFIEIRLAMPPYWDETMLTPLANAVHQYIASGVAYEYLATTLTTKDAATSARRE